MSKIATCLWFNDQAEQAAQFYVSIFKDATLGAVSHYGDNAPMPKGTVLIRTFYLDGKEFMALNGGPAFNFTPAISMFVHCDDQAEIDWFWERLTAEGGEPGQCGWLKDRFGVSWQIVPRTLGTLMSGPDRARANRVMQAVLGMTKLEIAALERAYNA